MIWSVPTPSKLWSSFSLDMDLVHTYPTSRSRNWIFYHYGGFCMHHQIAAHRRKSICNCFIFFQELSASNSITISKFSKLDIRKQTGATLSALEQFPTTAMTPCLGIHEISLGHFRFPIQKGLEIPATAKILRRHVRSLMDCRLLTPAALSLSFTQTKVIEGTCLSFLGFSIVCIEAHYFALY
jgi:hypothetical protein